MASPEESVSFTMTRSFNHLLPWERRLLAIAGLAGIASACAPVVRPTVTHRPDLGSTVGFTSEAPTPAASATTARETGTPNPDQLLRQRIEGALEGEPITLEKPLIEYVARFPGDLIYATLAEAVEGDDDSYALVKNFDCVFEVLGMENQLGEVQEIEIEPGVGVDPVVFRLWKPLVRVERLGVTVSLGVPTILRVDSVVHAGHALSCPEEPFLDLPGASEVGRSIGRVFWEFVEGFEEGK